MVVFPGENVNLHIFEPRYKQLIGECERDGITFGIPAFIGNQVMDMGTEIELVEVERRYPNGEMDIRTRGLGLFRIERFLKVAPGKLYAAGEVRRVGNELDGDPMVAQLLIDKLADLFRRLQVNMEIEDNPLGFRTYDYAHQVGFSLQQEYDFLCILDEMGRQQYLLEHLESILPAVAEMDEMRRKAQMNGHFKNVIPPI
jgi:Lon protease-like protein